MNFSAVDWNKRIEENLQNVKNHINNLKEVILKTEERFHLCKTDIEAVQKLLFAIDNINFDCKNFDKQDQDNIRLLKLKHELSQKSNKNDLIQLKISLDNQLKQIIELNKQNAKELERIKLMKTASCQTRHIQNILFNNLPSLNIKKHRMHSYQSSRPYITFELDEIRKYQRQALLKSPYGTIPLYRRQAWAAANLKHNHSLHLLRHAQNSLRMQIHNLLGYDPSDIYRIDKEKKIKKISNIEVFNSHRDISIVGNNNQLYRGRVDTCQIIPLKTSKEKQPKQKTNKSENYEVTKINIDQLDKTNKTIADEHLFEYLDWQTQFNEQDLPNEICEELFQHWKSNLFENREYICNKSISNSDPQDDPTELNLINKEIILPSEDIYDDQCICSECLCDCKKYQSDESLCECSQCSCGCLKDYQSKNEENNESVTDFGSSTITLIPKDINSQEHLTSTNDDIPSIPTNETLNVQPIEHNNEEIMISDCFSNRVDRWTCQFDIFQDTHKLSSSPEENLYSVLNPFQLDDPTCVRRRVLSQNQQ